jgi:hypothetical protein
VNERPGADDFAAQLRALYEAAGSPALAALVHQAARQRPAVKLDDSTLSGWFTGKSIPSPAKQHELGFLVVFLEGRAKQLAGYTPRGVVWWQQMRNAASQTRAHRGGRPPTRHPDSGKHPGGDAAPNAISTAVRSVYLEQVKRIAPPRLLDRNAELSELAAFCGQDGGSGYVWWRAEAWAGKSALMSTFVLRAPQLLPPSQPVVSFFITARLAGQDTREAFTSVLVEQLCALTGQEPPTAVTEEIREAVLLDLLGRTATACRTDGGRLILLVDGLDEDRSETLGPHAHSIAGLLPPVPPAGMRIIIAGRPNPPIPDDVPDWHPLRDPGIVRPLVASPHARDLQRLGQSELRRLLKGSPVEQDLLGLITAARGGLTGADLRELTGADLVHIEDVLHTVAGRTFTRQAPVWNPDSEPAVYLLGHEELHTAAVRYLGRDRLAEFQDRLHAWAEGYRQQGWPPDTPQFLLRGYTRLLQTTGGRPERLVTLATDAARQDRMLALSGGDAAAFDEIIAAQDLVMAQPEPDLLMMARLSIRRNDLTARNANIPSGLPALWAILGEPTRAESLARGITEPLRQARALAALARAMTEAGDTNRGQQLAAEAGTVIRGITHPRRPVPELADIVQAVDEADGNVGVWEEMITSSFPYQRQALMAAARVAAEAGDLDQAVTINLAMLDPYRHAEAVTAAVRAVAEAGDADRARQLANAETIAHAIADPAWRAQALTELALVAAEAGDADQARRLATSVEAMARAIADPYQHDQELDELALAVARAGDTVRAETIARSVGDRDLQAAVLGEVALIVAEGGDTARAETIVRNIINSAWRVRMPTGILLARAEIGDLDGARQWAVEVGKIAREMADPSAPADTLVTLSRLAAEAGDTDRAVTAARGIMDPSERARALAEIAGQVGMPAAGRLLAEAFAVGSWLIPLRVLAQLQPQIVLQIADERTRTFEQQ